MKPPTPKARALLLKLAALAERGIDGEKTQAIARLKKLKAAYDFAMPDEGEKNDLFAGGFRPGSVARCLCRFDAGEMGLAAFVKWGIEHGARVMCSFRGEDLCAEVSTADADRLAGVALHLAEGFRTLTRQFCERCPRDGGLFARGLYDGLTGEAKPPGEMLPSRQVAKIERGRSKKRLALKGPDALNIHPYAVALPLGKQLRFSVSLTKIAGELAEQLNPKQLAA
jgi:hypothetical protein